MAIKKPERVGRPRNAARSPQEAIRGKVLLSPAEAWVRYDGEARQPLGISAEPFEESWERGEFHDRSEDPAVLRVWMPRTQRVD